MTTDAIARVGISGWRYAPWRGDFYPKGLPQRSELEYASGRLGSIELNGTFYSLQKPQYFQAWRDETPDGFMFSVKGGRYITHILKLRDAQAPLANFFASGVLALGPKLGPFLWQLPERLTFDPDTLESFLAQLPHTTHAAVELAQRHDTKVDGREWARTDEERPIRHAMEVRSTTFDDPQYFEILRRHNVASVVADTAGRWPRFTELTSDFVYARLHGQGELYVGGYDDESLDRWANTVRGWLAEGRDSFIYFDNDTKVRAPYDAMALAQRLGSTPAWAPSPPDTRRAAHQ
jgi:uncharacterized protein YecE (DUF72 family)